MKIKRFKFMDKIIKLLKSSGEFLTSENIKSKALPVIHESKTELDDIQRRDTLREKLKTIFQFISQI